MLFEDFNVRGLSFLLFLCWGLTPLNILYQWIIICTECVFLRGSHSFVKVFPKDFSQSGLHTQEGGRNACLVESSRRWCLLHRHPFLCPVWEKFPLGSGLLAMPNMEEDWEFITRARGAVLWLLWLDWLERAPQLFVRWLKLYVCVCAHMHTRVLGLMSQALHIGILKLFPGHITATFPQQP